MRKLLKKHYGTLAPGWFRKLRKIVYLVTAGSTLTGTFQRFGVTPDDIVLIVGWIMLGLEVLNIALVGDTEESENITVPINENAA